MERESSLPSLTPARRSSQQRPPSPRITPRSQSAMSFRSASVLYGDALLPQTQGPTPQHPQAQTPQRLRREHTEERLYQSTTHQFVDALKRVRSVLPDFTDPSAAAAARRTYSLSTAKDSVAWR